MVKQAHQDAPPTGGYESIRFTRNIPHKAVSAALVGCTITLMSIWGMFQLGSIWRERRELKREKLWARLYILPMVQAEWDREWIRWRQAEIEREKEIMKDVEGWTAGEAPYINQRFAPPRYDLDGKPVRSPIIKWVDTGEPL